MSAIFDYCYVNPRSLLNYITWHSEPNCTFIFRRFSDDVNLYTKYENVSVNVFLRLMWNIAFCTSAKQTKAAVLKYWKSSIHEVHEYNVSAYTSWHVSYWEHKHKSTCSLVYFYRKKFCCSQVKKNPLDLSVLSSKILLSSFLRIKRLDLSQDKM